ncbi:MAG: AAA family ATPase [Bacilli bacterium]|nr:AAA family ATPase [Bacilli bacterium]
MKKIIFLSGLPGTGKSTYCSQNFINNEVIISSDEIRKKMTKAYNVFPKDPNLVYNEMISQTNELLKLNHDITIVLDSTFLDDIRRNYFIEKLMGYDNLSLIMLKVHSIETILKRNKSRNPEKWVPEEIILDMAKRFSSPSQDYVHFYSELKEIYVD